MGKKHKNAIIPASLFPVSHTPTIPATSVIKHKPAQKIAGIHGIR
jgi:hypothetical protein